MVVFSWGVARNDGMKGNKMDMRKFILCLVAAGMFASCMADEESTTSTESKHGYWTNFTWFNDVITVTNRWVDGYVPTNATDVMHFQKQDDPTYLYHSWLMWPKGDWTFGTLADSSPKTEFRVNSGYGCYYYFNEQESGARARWNTVEDCFGGFGTRNSGTSHVYRAMTHTILGINTPESDHTMLMDEPSGLGAIEKVGPGTMVLQNPIRGGIRLKEGTVTIGQPDLEDAYVPGAAIHLDASATNTFTWTEDEDGVKRLTKWSDVDGTQYYAGAPYTHEYTWQGPFASSFEVNGVPLIDFGAFTTNGTSGGVRTPGDLERYGAGCMMDMKGGYMANVREVFFAFAFTSTNVTSAPLTWWSANTDAAQAAFTMTGNILFSKHPQMRYNGYARFNGAPMSCSDYFYEYRDGHSLGVVSGALTNGANASVWHVGGNPGNFMAGGMRIAEAFAYTNSLTIAERRQNNAYLMRKWHDRKVDDLYPWDVDYLQLKGTNTAVNVEDGSVARIRTVHAPMDDVDSVTNLVKVGGGTLELDRVSTNAIVVVRGGNVKYVRETAEIADSPQPAVWPFFHCDATQSDKFIYESDEDGNATTNILAWQDIRDDVDITMTNFTTKTTAMPFYNANGPRGMPCVDFGGTEKTTDGARLGLSCFLDASGSPKYIARIIEGFIVWRNKGTADSAPQIFTDYAAVSFARDAKSLVTYNFADSHGGGTGPRNYSAIWRVDGRFMNQENEFYGMGVDDWVVVNIRASCPIYANALATFRNENGGGIQVGEFIAYDRPLSDFEGRQTEAYLLKKWKNMDHPDEGEDFSGGIVFADGVSNVLDIASDRAFSRIECSGDLVKSGAGVATVAPPTGATALAIDEGAIVVSGDWTMPDDLSVPVGVVTSETACVSVSGALTIPSSGILSVTFGDEDPEAGRYTLISAGSISGTLSGWTVETDSTKRSVAVVKSGNTIELSVSPKGLMIMFR